MRGTELHRLVGSSACLRCDDLIESSPVGFSFLYFFPRLFFSLLIYLNIDDVRAADVNAYVFSFVSRCALEPSY